MTNKGHKVTYVSERSDVHQNMRNTCISVFLLILINLFAVQYVKTKLCQVLFMGLNAKRRFVSQKVIKSRFNRYWWFTKYFIIS